MDTDGDIVLGNGQLCCLLDGDSGGYVCEAPDRVRPDLKDSATAGCVMAMVRKKYGPNTWTVYTPRGWQVMTSEHTVTVDDMAVLVGGDMQVTGHVVFRPRAIIMASEEMPTEIYALIAALAKECA
jgi:hypothetical protein